MMIPPDELISTIKDNDVYTVAIHVSPDGDALGSALALNEALRLSGKKTILYSKSGVPYDCSFLPQSELFVHTISEKDTAGSILILIDCNSPVRAGLESIDFKKSIVIDHHATEREFGDIKWIVPEASATGILIFYLIKTLGVTLTKDMATNLYSAIAVDTGTFRFSNTTKETFAVAIELVEAGAKPSFVAYNLYNKWSDARFKLLVKTLNSLEIHKDIAIATLTKEDFKETNATPDDTEDLVNYPMMKNVINISVLLREADFNLWRGSLRSNGVINVAEIAEKFGGGGHRNAAGFRVKDDINIIKKRLLSYLNHREK